MTFLTIQFARICSYFLRMIFLAKTIFAFIANKRRDKFRARHFFFNLRQIFLNPHSFHHTKKSPHEATFIHLYFNVNPFSLSESYGVEHVSGELVGEDS